MSIEQIKAAYPDEWILLGNQEKDGMEYTGGDVIAHHKDKRELARIVPEWRHLYQSAALIYTGTFPKKRYWL